MGEDDVLFERNGNIAKIILNRPSAHNSMTVDMVSNVFQLLTEIASDDGVHLVELTGSGDRFFCPGADLDRRAMEAGGPINHDAASTIKRLQIPVLLHEMPQISIAAINGSCAGAGLGWACACDVRLASDAAMFNVAFLAVGVAGDMGLPWTLPRLLGAGKAREMFFLGDKFDAREAAKVGLVSAVFPQDSFRGEINSVMQRLSNTSWDALRTMKANFLAAERMSFPDYVDLESERHMRIAAGQLFAESARAFIQNRS
jgi:2-(1,2-epoxy-1,2-dihydrophenyl)acetyl-CoA isomerase